MIVSSTYSSGLKRFFGFRKFTFIQVTLILISSLLPYAAYSQVQTELHPEIILLGDTASLKITVTSDARQYVDLPQLGDSLNNFLEISKVKLDSMKVGNNANYIQTITLTCFEAGEFLVNALPVVIDGDTVLTQSFQLEVKDLEVGSDLDKMYPIKPIVSQEITWWEKNKKYLAYWLGGLLLLLIIVVLIWLYIKAARNKKYVSSPLLPPYEEALDNLRKLDKNNLLAQQKYTEYYTDLSFILRRYFTRRFDFPALALLSSDLPTIMKEKEILTIQEAAEFTDFLKDADLAKYARRIPSEDKHLAYRKWIESIIYKTRPILEDDLQEQIRDEDEKEKLRKINNR